VAESVPELRAAVASERSSATIRRVGLEGRTSPEETQVMIDEGLVESDDAVHAASGAH